jgi:tetratricopeptide (TPR) repeat protein
VARALVNMGAVYLKAGNLEAAERTYREACERLERKLGPEHLDVSTVLSGLGTTLRKEEKFEAADANMRRALAIRVKALGESHSSTQKLIKALAELNTAWGKPAHTATYSARLTTAP